MIRIFITLLKKVKSQHDSTVSSNGYRVATLCKSYLTIIGIIIQSLKNINNKESYQERPRFFEGVDIRVLKF